VDVREVLLKKVILEHGGVDDEPDAAVGNRLGACRLLVAGRIEEALVLLDEVDDLLRSDGAHRGPRAPPRGGEEEVTVVQCERFVPCERYELELDVPIELDFLRSLHES